MSAAPALGKQYGKKLALVKLLDEDSYVVNEIDRDGLTTGQWGQGETGEEALAQAKERLDTLYRGDVQDEAREALVGMARVLPSDVLKEVLLERGDWNLEVKP